MSSRSSGTRKREKKRQARVIAVGSFKGGSGKSLVALCLGWAAKQDNKKPIIVDCDFTGTELIHLEYPFGAGFRFGLATYLMPYDYPSASDEEQEGYLSNKQIGQLPLVADIPILPTYGDPQLWSGPQRMSAEDIMSSYSPYIDLAMEKLIRDLVRLDRLVVLDLGAFHQGLARSIHELVIRLDSIQDSEMTEDERKRSGRIPGQVVHVLDDDLRDVLEHSVRSVRLRHDGESENTPVESDNPPIWHTTVINRVSFSSNQPPNTIKKMTEKLNSLVANPNYSTHVDHKYPATQLRNVGLYLPHSTKMSKATHILKVHDSGSDADVGVAEVFDSDENLAGCARLVYKFLVRTMRLPGKSISPHNSPGRR